jgi:hypothetical protein
MNIGAVAGDGTHSTKGFNNTCKHVVNSELCGGMRSEARHKDFVY